VTIGKEEGREKRCNRTRRERKLKKGVKKMRWRRVETEVEQ
jgi:hypothetical protein